MLREMGPTGAFCGIHGRTANLFFSTIPQCTVILVISIIYTLTWCHIRKAAIVATSLGNDVTKKSTRAAKTMTLFVVVFVIQYWASGIYAVWQTVGEPPIELMYPVIMFTNIGGLLNGVVYVTRIRKRCHQSTIRVHPERKVFMVDKI
ncbi:hypothetical protein FSP39_000918 [Pinctada imbricata]|uniref:Uncharacterized protein n=1 Tax=Pinctada imbricata TaxID=66713 RepID=A0AA88Y9U7_PINIB|nr:hypothetical protein FSP39_000918 [Pinctada imbricata]